MAALTFREENKLTVTRTRKRQLTAGFCNSFAKLLLQTRARLPISCSCESNLAEIAQNVTSNGANAADCKQRRKCLEQHEPFWHDQDGRFTYSNAPIKRFEV